MSALTLQRQCAHRELYQEEGKTAHPVAQTPTLHALPRSYAQALRAPRQRLEEGEEKLLSMG